MNDTSTGNLSSSSGVECSFFTKLNLHCYHEGKVNGANMGPIWGRQDSGGPHIGPMNIAIWIHKEHQVYHCHGLKLSLRMEIAFMWFSFAITKLSSEDVRLHFPQAKNISRCILVWYKNIIDQFMIECVQVVPKTVYRKGTGILLCLLLWDKIGWYDRNVPLVWMALNY